MSQAVSAADIAEALGQAKRHINDRASEEKWMHLVEPVRGGRRKLYPVLCLPHDVKPRVLAMLASRVAVEAAAAAKAIKPAPVTDRKGAAAARHLGLMKFAEAPESAKRRAEARLALVELAGRYVRASGMAKSRGEAQFCDAYSAGKIEVPAWVRAEIASVSPNSLINWQRALHQEGLARLAGNYGQHRIGAGFIDSRPELANFIRAMLTDHPHCGAGHVMNGVRARFVAEDHPNHRTLQRWIAAWKAENEQLLAAVANPDGWRSRYQAAAGKADADIVRLNQRWEMDSTKGEILFSDGVRGVVVQAIDVFSRRMKLHLARSSSAVAVAACFRKSLLAWGVPEELGIDNGSDYTSKYMTRVIGGLKIGLDIAPPFTPEAKPFVERAFGTFCRDIVELLPGFVGHSVADRKAIESRRSFAERLTKGNKEGAPVEARMTAAEFQEFCDWWTDTYYLNRVHSSLGMTPAAKAASYAGDIERIENERALDVLLAPAPGAGSGGGEGVRVVGKKGIKLDGGWFVAAELGGIVGSEVRVLLDEGDIGLCYVFSVDGPFICKAVCPELSGLMSRPELAAAMRGHQKKALAEAKAELKQNARKQKTADIAREIMRSDAFGPGNVTYLPQKSTPYATEALHEAARAAETADATPAPIDMSAPAVPAQIIELSSVRDPAHAEMEAKERRFLRWKAIDASIAAGGEVSPADRRWHKNYARDPECTSRLKGERMVAEGLVG